ncbi:hypothetical protein [Photobacterium damselae]|uniref:hypothetical protein n=1 Tax=Photobacterium damselae TaxID=38293 RepID=UPI00370B7089
MIIYKVKIYENENENDSDYDFKVVTDEKITIEETIDCLYFCDDEKITIVSTSHMSCVTFHQDLIGDIVVGETVTWYFYGGDLEPVTLKGRVIEITEIN